ncbi:hypothetical protein MMC09_005515 [Bachmanniomyces sp. S44760]|nr:hypothetical protein [Bachmanniomyces sp. S44760]
MDSTKLRRTFHYPSENSEDDDNPREIDEEGQYIRGHKGGSSVINAVVEQEKYIAKLRRENEEKNDQYERILFVIPIISMMTYWPALLTAPALQPKIISLFCITSLAATSYILLFLPNGKPQLEGSKPPIGHSDDEPSPVEKHLGYLNAGLSFLIALNAGIWYGKKGVHDGFWVLCLLPGCKFANEAIGVRLMALN